MIKTLAAIINSAEHRPERYHIVAAVRDPRAVPVAHMVAGDQVEIVLTTDLIARIMAQTCRQSGLSTVYTELLDFSGNEFYFHEEPGLVGKTFGDAVFAYEDSLVLGICPGGGVAQLSPAMDTRIAAGDRLIVDRGGRQHHPSVWHDQSKDPRRRHPTRPLQAAGARAHADPGGINGPRPSWLNWIVTLPLAPRSRWWRIYPRDELTLGDRISGLKNQTYKYLEGDTRRTGALWIACRSKPTITSSFCAIQTRRDMQQADPAHVPRAPALTRHCRSPRASLLDHQ